MTGLMNENLKRGTIELMLLTLLKEEDKYGYQLVQELFARSKGLYELKEGTMYPSLYRLLEKGLISDHKELVGRKRTRVYYHLEPAGEQHLEMLTKEYCAITKGIDSVINYSEK